MERDAVEITGIHEALINALTSPIVAVDRSGVVMEWNHAAERYTGLLREDALGKEIWNLQARIAPAVIPYEEALTRSKEQFAAMVARNNRNLRNWNEEYDWDILSTRGERRHAHIKAFPLIVQDHLIIVNILDDLEPAESLSEHAV